MTRHRPRAKKRRSGRAGLVLTFLLVGSGAVFAVAVALDSMTGGGPIRPACYIDRADDHVRLSPEQMSNAALITGVGMEMGVGDRAIVVALATAMQESSLRNLDHGDRDSLGLFQQRPSQGWGTPAQVQDRNYASRTFYERLAGIPGFAQMPLTEAAQAVQISAFPLAYAKHEDLATALHGSLTGRSRGTLTCALPRSTGLDHSRLLSELHSAHPNAEVSAVGESLHLAPASDGELGPSEWALANWAVATTSDTGVSEVRVGSHVWTRSDGWHKGSTSVPGVTVR